MTFGLYISDGWTTVVLSDPTSGGVYEYTPRTPRLAVTRVDRPQRDGQDVTGSQYENVTESCVWNGGDLRGFAGTLQTTLGKLNALFDQAARYQTGQRGQSIKPVYVYFQRDGDSVYYRSEILAGSAQPSDEAIDWQWRTNQVEVTVAWERRPYWEGAEVQADLDAGGGGPTYTKTMYNGAWTSGGSTAYNTVWVTLGYSGFPVFDVPSPAKLTFKATGTGTVGYIWIGQNAGLNINNWVHMQQAESATPLVVAPDTSSTITGNNNYSNGGYRRVTWARTTYTNLMEWTISSAQLDIASGELFNAILVSAANPGLSDLRAKLQIVSTGDVVLAETAPILVNGIAQGFGNMRIPPHLSGLSSYDAVKVRLVALRDAGTSTTWDIDYLYLMPALRFRYYQPRFPLVANQVLVDDPYSGQVYQQASDGSGKQANHVVYGAPFYIQPTDKNRFYFLWQRADTGFIQAGMTADVSVSYRPRRLTL